MKMSNGKETNLVGRSSGNFNARATLKKLPKRRLSEEENGQLGSVQPKTLKVKKKQKEGKKGSSCILKWALLSAAIGFLGQSAQFKKIKDALKYFKVHSTDEKTFEAAKRKV